MTGPLKLEFLLAADAGAARRRRPIAIDLHVQGHLGFLAYDGDFDNLPVTRGADGCGDVAGALDLGDFTERFLKVQLVFDEPRPAAPPITISAPAPASRRFNALGIAEEVGPDGETATTAVSQARSREPKVVGAGRGVTNLAAGTPNVTTADLTNVGRNDPCPCGSGKKFKKCHGA